MPEKLRLELRGVEYRAGDTVSGRVYVDETIERCRRFDVYLEYSGQRITKNEVGRTTLEAGPVRRGQRFDFVLPIPYNVPFSFHGHKHDVSWRVVARADISMALDPKAVQEISVGPRVVRDDPGVIEAIARDIEPRKKPELSTGCTILMVLVLGPLVLSAVVILLPIVLMIVAHKKILNTRLQSFSLEVPERPIVLGEWVPVVVRFRLKRAIDLVKLKVLLKGTEQWSTGSGNSRSTHYHHFYEQEHTVLEDTVLAIDPGSREHLFEYRTAIQVPREGLPAVDESTVYYRVNATAEIRGWPDPGAQKDLDVVSLRLDSMPRSPAGVAPQATSQGVVFVPKGANPPPNVDIATAGTTIWWWIITPILGMAMTIAGGLLLVDTASLLFVGLAAVGFALLVGGLVGFVVTLFR